MNLRKRKNMNLRKVFHLTSAGILLLGLASAVLFYISAINDTSDSSYDVIGGFVYPGGGAYNKKYVHDLQLYGGNAAMLGDQFTRWFAGLWRGKTLSYTVACIAVVLAFLFFVAGNNVPGNAIKTDESAQE